MARANSTFPSALAERVLVLDGGLGTLLEARGHDLSSALWSARLLVEEPNAIRAAHAEYVAAGADVITTASYQVGYDNLGAIGMTDAEVDALLHESVALARAAAPDADRRVFVAASIGPFGAVRADGSEYRGDYGVGVDELRVWHRRRLRVLADAGADVLAIETIPSPVEAEAILAELEGLGVAAWLSLSGSSAGFSRATRATTLASASEVPETRWESIAVHPRS